MQHQPSPNKIKKTWTKDFLPTSMHLSYQKRQQLQESVNIFALQHTDNFYLVNTPAKQMFPRALKTSLPLLQYIYFPKKFT